MLKKLKKRLEKKLRGIKRNNIVDIFLFGSAAKGKEFPNDIDISVIFRKEINKSELDDIASRLKDFNIHISALKIDDFFIKPHSLIKTLLVEGISILTYRKFSQNFGFSSYALYSYELSKLKLSEKVKFVYLLKGRKERGFIEKANGEWITDSCFIIPIEKDKEILEIFKRWSVPFKRKEMLLH